LQLTINKNDNNKHTLISTPGKKKTVLFVVTGNAPSRDVDVADASLLIFFTIPDFFLSTK